MTSATAWTGPWNPEAWTKGDKGLWIAATVASTRFHTVTTKDALYRFVALHLTVQNAFERYWNQYQSEQTPDLRKPERSANPVLSNDALAKIVALPAGLVDASILKTLHPHVPGVVELWADPDLVKGVTAGAEVLLKTEGGFFVKWITNNTAGRVAGNFTGKETALMGAVGGKMVKVEEAEVLAHEQKEGCAEDEWDD